jgi:hypothetical protein
MERVFYVKLKGAFQPPPAPVPGIFRTRLASAFKKMTPMMEGLLPQRWSFAEFVDSYRDSRRIIYERAAASLEVSVVTRALAQVRSFIKVEKTNDTHKVPVPRLIQPRDPRYNILVGCFVKPLEHPLYGVLNHLFGYTVIASGLNVVEQGTLFASAWARFPDPCGWSGDARRFDQHVSVDALRFEHSVYLRCVPRSDREELGRYLSWQLRTSGVAYAPDGVIRYVTRGGRKSGDMNTSLGNKLLMCLMIYSYLELHKLLDMVQLVNNGDDFTIICARKTLPDLAGLPAWLLDFGFTLIMEPPAREIEHIRFCQTSPVFDGEGYRMVRDPRICVDKDLVCLASVQNEKEVMRWCHSVGECGLALAGCIPVFWRLYALMQRQSDEGCAAYDNGRSGMQMLAAGMEAHTRTCEPTPECRTSFFRAFDITPGEQESMESLIDDAIFTLEPESVLTPGPLSNFM